MRTVKCSATVPRHQNLEKGDVSISGYRDMEGNRKDEVWLLVYDAGRVLESATLVHHN